MPAMEGDHRQPDHRELIRVVRALRTTRITDARTAVLGGIWVPLWPNGMVERGPAFWVAFLLVGVLSDERTEIQEKRTFA